MTARPDEWPIVILSYNRPGYLKKVLHSVKAQRNIGWAGRRIALFQDGWICQKTGKTLYDPKISAQNIDMFLNVFPDGDVFSGETNLDIGLNYDRAERFVFEEINASAGIFLEDDLILGPVYLSVLEILIAKALEDERIGYVQAIGNHRIPAISTLNLPEKLGYMGYLWGYGLTKRHWLKCRPYMEKYLEIISKDGYRGQDNPRIHALTRSWGIDSGDTYQDRIKSFITGVVGCIKLNTEVPFGKYIGKIGMNFTPRIFETLGFSDEDNFFCHIPDSNFDFQSVSYDPFAPDYHIYRIAA